MRKVYSPNLLEKHTSSGEISNDPKTLVENGIGSKISKISVDFINDLGYFVEDNGGVKKYYPKGFKISLAGAIVGYKNQYAGRPGNYKRMEHLSETIKTQ